MEEIHHMIEKGKNKELAEELKAQMILKEQSKQKEREASKTQDYNNLYEFIHHNPFGRMGAGAPIRDSEGHVVANRMKMFDEAAATSFHKSFYHNEEMKNPHQMDINSQRKQSIQNLNDSEIGLQFLEWSQQERKRKNNQMDEWKKNLDEQTYLAKRRKDDGKFIFLIFI